MSKRFSVCGTSRTCEYDILEARRSIPQTTLSSLQQPRQTDDSGQRLAHQRGRLATHCNNLRCIRISTPKTTAVSSPRPPRRPPFHQHRSVEQSTLHRLRRSDGDPRRMSRTRLPPQGHGRLQHGETERQHVLACREAGADEVESRAGQGGEKEGGGEVAGY